MCHNNNNKIRTWQKTNNDNDNDNDNGSDNDNDNDNDNVDDKYLGCNGRFSIYFILILNVLSLEEDRAKCQDLLVRNRRLREVTGLRNIDKSRHFVKTEVNNCHIRASLQLFMSRTLFAANTFRRYHV